jgi:rubredoxin/flavin reductase (DIM6/NTAB) family NADH-FMN oxidoreductase RutF
MDPHVLHNISYGMFIVSSFKDRAYNGQIANTVFQITNDPITVAVSINKSNLTHDYIAASGIFSVSILMEEAPPAFIGTFGFKSGRAVEKFKNIKYKVLPSGCPVVIDHTIGYFEARVCKQFDCGSHTLFLGEMTAGEVVQAGKPMTYDYYHQVKRGTTPQSAPTFIKEESQKKEEPAMQKYRCTICNYVYDPAIGDPDGGIAAGTPFEKIPDSWVCPVCGAAKADFEKV